MEFSQGDFKNLSNDIRDVVIKILHFIKQIKYIDISMDHQILQS